jgi:hypothetical protein
VASNTALAIGVFMGCLAGMSAAVLFALIRRRLSTKTSYPARELSALGLLPTFIGSGSWASSQIGTDVSSFHEGSYWAAVVLSFLLVATYPGLALIRYCAEFIAPDATQ